MTGGSASLGFLAGSGRLGGSWASARFKRVFDIFVAGLLTLISLPISGLIAIAIKLDSRGPVIFRQKRIGARPRRVGDNVVWDIQPFEVLKFRSMDHASDPSVHINHIQDFVNGTLEPSPDGSYKISDDHRITRVGRLLRRASLDELPQLINVLRGDMSLVGPRPVPDYEVAGYQDWQYERLNALPGITGMWQVHGRGRVTFDEMIRMDIGYVNDRTFAGDLKLLALTLPAVFSKAGAE